MPATTTIIAWTLPANVVQQLADATRRHATLMIVRSAEEVREALSSSLNRTESTCLVVAVPSEPHGPFWVDLRELRAIFPGVPVIAVALLGISSYLSAMRLGQYAISELLTADPDLRVEHVDGALLRAHNDSVISRIWRSAALNLPETYTTILRRALRLAHRPLSAVQLADSAQMHERTLRKYCRRHHMPSPGEIVAWARLLVAAYYLDEGSRSIKNVADHLDFPTTDALRKQIARYTSQSVTALRNRGALDSVARLMERQTGPQQRATAHASNIGT
jgi:AraC-like DNA-binding protein